MNVEQLTAQEAVLRIAGDESPLGVYAGMLTARADELKDCIVSAKRATAEGWEYDIVPAAAVEPGCPIYDKSLGPVTVLRSTRGGTGIECRNDSEWGDPIAWINPLSGTSPLVVLNGKQASAVVDDDFRIEDGMDPQDIESGYNR